MNISELRRIVADEITEGRDLKRDDATIASRILDALAKAGALHRDSAMEPS